MALSLLGPNGPVTVSLSGLHLVHPGLTDEGLPQIYNHNNNNNNSNNNNIVVIMLGFIFSGMHSCAFQLVLEIFIK